MGRLKARVVLTALVAALALASTSWADDTELFAKGNVPPNVLVILDTSQSMTWFNKDGNTVGDEFPGLGAQSGSRMWIAKNVLNNVITQYSDKIAFGLATYNQGNIATNVTLQNTCGGNPRSWYYSTGWSAIPFGGWLAYTFGSNYYFRPCYFDLRVPQAGLGGPANATDPAGYNPATLKPNSASFTLTWALRDPSSIPVTSNPNRELWAGQSYIAPTTHNQPFCEYQYQRSDDNQVTWYFTGSTWTTAPGGCPAGGNIPGTETQFGAQVYTDTCTFVRRLTVDTPTPYQYSCQRYLNGAPSGGPWTEYYQDNQGASFNRNVATYPAWWRRTYSYGQVNLPVVDNAGRPYRPDQYRWTYYYDATCKTNCKNSGKFWQWSWSTPWFIGDSTAPTYGYVDCQANRVNDPYVDPPNLGLPACGSSWVNGSGQAVWSPSATGAWGVPYDATYYWQGNNYALNTDTECADPNKGGQVLVDVGSGTLPTIQNYLGTGTDPTKELHAATVSTPLAGSLSTALTYFTDPEGVVMTDAMKQCRKNFVLLITDGGESCLIDLTIPGQKAAALAGLSDPAGGVPVYVVGLDQGGLSTDEKTVLSSIASNGGTGDYFKASDTTSLTSALNAILGQILSQDYSFASILVPRMRFQDNLIALQSAMLPNTDTNIPFWKGYLTAYQLNSDGTLPTDANHLLDPTKVVQYWEASQVLAGTSPNARNMLVTLWDTSDPNFANWGYKTIGFTRDNRVYQAVNCAWDFFGTVWANPGFPDVNQDGQHTLADCPAFVNLLRGNNAFGWGSKLGDIFHSQPVVVGAPSPTYLDTTFDPSNPATNLPFSAAPDTFGAFRNAQSTRTRIAVVGANDGFLHAFNAGNWNNMTGAYDTGTGAEVWAYLPVNLTWPYSVSLQGLGCSTAQAGTVSCAHNYFVDGTAKVADVWLDDDNDGVKAADGSEWHTVALANLRQGGQGIFHLDITDTSNPKPISNGTNSYPPYFYTCGQSWSEPAIGKVKVQIGGKKVDRWVAFFGDGDTSSYVVQSPSCGKAFYAVDLKTGHVIWQVFGPTDQPLYMTYDMVGSPIAIDTNGDGYIDRVYVGDRGGQIWRFDVSAVATSGGGDVDPANLVLADNWVVNRLFAGPSTQMFYEKLAAALDGNGTLWIYAGTGDRSHPLLVDPADAGTPSKGRDGRLYGIRDTYVSGSPPPAPWQPSDLQDMTGVNTVDPNVLTSPGGWLVKLDPGEKLFTDVEVFDQVVYFSTELPQSTITGTGCSTSPSTARLYMMYYLTGGGVTDIAAFTAATPSASTRYFTIGAGAPVRTIVSTLSLGGGATVITGTSQEALLFGKKQNGDFSILAPNNLRFTRYWLMQ